LHKRDDEREEVFQHVSDNEIKNDEFLKELGRVVDQSMESLADKLDLQNVEQAENHAEYSHVYTELNQLSSKDEDGGDNIKPAVREIFICESRLDQRFLRLDRRGIIVVQEIVFEREGGLSDEVLELCVVYISD